MSLTITTINSSYVLLHEDTYKEQPEWTQLQIKVLQENEDIFACAVGGADELPHDHKIWKITSKKNSPLYIEGVTSITYVLFRKTDFMELIEYLEEFNLLFKPVNLYDFCYISLQKRWVRLRGQVYGALKQICFINDIKTIKEKLV